MTTSATSLESMMDRLARVENQHHRLKHACLALLVLTGIGLLTAAQVAPKEKTVEAEKFVLRDQTGKQRALLHLSQDGPHLVLFDEAEKPRAVLKVDKEGAALSFGDDTGKLRMNLSADGEDSGLTLCDDEGNLRAGLVHLKQNGPGLILRNQHGRPISSKP